MTNHHRNSKHKLYLAYSEQYLGSDDHHAYLEFLPKALSLSPESAPAELSYTQEPIGIDFNPQSGQAVFLVLVRYTDLIETYFSEDEQKCTRGRWFTEGIYNNRDEAIAIKDAITKETYTGYAPWDGYPSKLESVEIWSTRVNQGKYEGINVF